MVPIHKMMRTNKLGSQAHQLSLGYIGHEVPVSHEGGISGIGSGKYMVMFCLEVESRLEMYSQKIYYNLNHAI